MFGRLSYVYYRGDSYFVLLCFKVGIVWIGYIIMLNLFCFYVCKNVLVWLSVRGKVSLLDFGNGWCRYFFYGCIVSILL